MSIPRWVSHAAYIKGCHEQARRCKKCPDFCILWTWVKYPSPDKTWFIWPGTRYTIRQSYSRFLENVRKSKGTDK